MLPELFLLFFSLNFSVLANKSENNSEASLEAENLSVYPIIMPMVVPSKNEVYLCTSVDLSQTNDTFWIRGFEPRVSKSRVHHMIVAASATPPPETPFNVWNCGNEKHRDPSYPDHKVFPQVSAGYLT